MQDAFVRPYETFTADVDLPYNTIRQLCVQSKRGKTAARDRILCAHMGLVICVAKRFYRPGLFLDLGDLVQQGCLGLLHAIDKFDPNRQSRGRRVQFKTYAHYWVAHSIRREIENHGRTISVPVHRLRDVQNTVISLDQTVWQEEEGDSVASQVADVRDTPDQWCRAWEAKLLLESLLQKLSARTQSVLRQRYGLAEHDGPLSQKQVGERLGVAGSRVGHQERAGLHILRNYALTSLVL